MNDFLPLINVGAVGFVLAWFMLRNERGMAALWEMLREVLDAIDRNSRTLLLHTIALPSAAPQIKASAEKELAELETLVQKRDARAETFTDAAQKAQVRLK